MQNPLIHELLSRLDDTQAQTEQMFKQLGTQIGEIEQSLKQKQEPKLRMNGRTLTQENLEELLEITVKSH